jgi:hypothetical protein
MDLAEQGWPAGTARVESITAGLLYDIASKQTVTHYGYDVTGIDFDIGRAMDGEAECWLDPYERVDLGDGIVTIGVSVSASAGMNAEVLFQRGSAACALAVLIEESGRQVEITLESTVFGYSERGGSYTIVVPLKTAGQPLDVDRVTFAVAHPATFRRLVFGAEEAEELSIRNAFGFIKASGYGVPRPMPEGLCPPFDVYVRELRLERTGHLNDSTTLAREWVLEQLRAQGIIERE